MTWDHNEQLGRVKLCFAARLAAALLVAAVNFAGRPAEAASGMDPFTLTPKRVTVNADVTTSLLSGFSDVRESIDEIMHSIENHAHRNGQNSSLWAVN